MAELAPGVYEQLVTARLSEALGAFDPDLISREDLDPADAHIVLARHIGELARRALQSVGGGDRERLVRQVELANGIANAIAAAAPDADLADQLVAESQDVLRAVVERAGVPGPVTFPPRPETPLNASALLVNGRDQPRIGSEVQRELASADRVDLLCAFIKWHGLRVLEGPLQELLRRGGQLRVITTTYIGATERRAVDRLVEMGAEVRVSYETRTTRLHAKAWLFHRRTGFSTAYVGSSNLSKTALLDGLEWNVRISAVEQPHLLDTFAATFEQYWADPSFEAYDPTSERDRGRLDRALAAESGSRPQDLPLEITTLDVQPWSYQREILDTLAAEREVHGRWRNLVVMATGTGKTVVAALDYRRLHTHHGLDSVLFVAHREELLDQSRTTFRHAMRDGTFGERFVGGERPTAWRHVFASVQSLARVDLDADLDPERFDMVVVDEFHHAMAPTYDRLLQHLRPRVLLGLTATPERADTKDVRDWFNGHTAVDLRLWEAIEQGTLCPFQYFGVHDDVDLSRLRFKRGEGYDTAQLTNLYTAQDARNRLILQQLRDKIADLGRMRALGFCVSIDHAEFMARRFTETGIPSLDLPLTQRRRHPQAGPALAA